MEKISKYILSQYSFVESSSVEEILEVGYLSKNGNPIPSFDENLLVDLCSNVQKIFKTEKNILELKGVFIIVGDIHGSLHDLLRILKNMKANSKVLFLGDYIDRGNFSLECITILFALKILKPDNIFLLRGNHEFDSICSQYGFKNEILNYHNPKKSQIECNKQKSKIEHSKLLHDQLEDEYYSDHSDIYCYKYSELLYNSFIKAFSYLPIAAIINDTTFCVHGGISPRLETAMSINKLIVRPVNNFEESFLLTDLLWGDPYDNYSSLFDDNPRGKGYLFNKYSLFKFLTDNSFNRIIRAHECVQNGSKIQFDDRCITVFSASSYSSQNSNKSSILLLFEKEEKVEVMTFPPVYRLQKSEAAYYKVESLFHKDVKEKSCFSFLHPSLNSSDPNRVVVKRGSKPKISSYSSENFALMKGSQLSLSPLIKPKLVTNQRKSCQYKRQALNQSGSLQNILQPTINAGVSSSSSCILNFE